MLPEARKDRVLVEKIGDELIVYDQDRDHAHCLNQTAMLVWELCDGQTTVLKIAKTLNKKLHVPVDERLVWLALDQLEKAHLLREPLQPAGNIRRRISRRQLIQQLSLIGALAVLAPVVTSIMAPDPAMANSFFFPPCDGTSVNTCTNPCPTGTTCRRISSCVTGCI